MSEQLFNDRPFGQFRGQVAFEQETAEPETWRVTIAHEHGQSVMYPEARSAAIAVDSAQITIDAFCWRGAEIVAADQDL